ncbi:MAG: hypothetical protein AB7H48_08080 [Parachlamydiales bacterium]
MTIVSVVSGIFIAEGFSRVVKSDHCPQKIKDIPNTLIDPLKTLPLAYLICGTLATIVLTQGALTLAIKALKGRVRFIPTLSEQMATALGAYRLSIPLLLGMTIHLSRRESLEALIKSLQSLIELTREAGSSLSNLLLDSDELVAKVEKEIQEGLDGISASIHYIVFANEPRVIRTISREISDFEDHLRNLSTKMPAFERKLEAARKLLVDSKSHLINQIRKIESESDRIDQILQEIQKEHLSYWEEKFKSFLDQESLIDQKQTLNEKLAQLKELSNTIDLITSGISLVYQSDIEEIKAIRRWNIYIKYTPLPILEDAFLIACDMPSIGFKMFNEIVFNTKEQGDDLFSHRRRRIKLSEILPEAVENFSQALIAFKQARKGILDSLTQIKVNEPSIKKNWDEENACLRKGRGFFSDAELTFCATLFKNHPLGKIAGALQRY